MKIISWNCNMAFRKKVDSLMELKPDIAVIQECESDNKINHKDIHQSLWIGKNVNKGVGIFSFNPDLNIELIDFDYENNHWFVPFSINKDKIVTAVWAMNHRDNEIKNKIQPTYRTLTDNTVIIDKSQIVLGDFNNNTIWDEKGKKKYSNGIFADIIDVFRKSNFSSLYHSQTDEEFGKELNPTHIWRKSLKTTYHIDYCFMQNSLLNDSRLDIKNGNKWLEISDHYPLVINTKL